MNEPNGDLYKTLGLLARSAWTCLFSDQQPFVFPNDYGGAFFKKSDGDVFFAYAASSTSKNIDHALSVFAKKESLCKRIDQHEALMFKWEINDFGDKNMTIFNLRGLPHTVLIVLKPIK
jgi:hypothetical protein